MRLLLVLAVACSLLGSATVVGAQTNASRSSRLAQAKKAFAAGSRAYEDGEFTKALRYFRRAHKLTGSPDLLYNIATVSDRLRRDEEALDAYVGYLKARPRSSDREHVEGRIKVLRTSIEAERRAERDAQLSAERAAAEAEAKIKKERPLTRYVGPGPGPWITIGAGSAVAITGSVFLGLGIGDINEVEDAPSPSQLTDVSEAMDKGPRRTKVGVSLVSIGAAAVLGGVIWQLTGGREEEVPEISIGPTGVLVRGKF